eukprot:49679_1
MAATQANKQREIITVNCGGTGCALGQNILQQFAAEHGISSLGYKQFKTPNDSTIPILFDETSEAKFISRSLFTDLDPYSIQNIRARYPSRSLLHSEYLLNGATDAGFNFAMGHYTQGKKLMESIQNALRTLVESTDNFQGFLFNHSMSGGTGGGLGSLILERVSVDYRKKTKFGMSVLFDGDRASSSLEIYNALLTQHWLLDHTDIDIVLDNKACRKICKDVLNTNRPTYAHYNGLMNKMIGDITASSRFGLNEIFGSLHMDFCPFPRLHFLTSSMWPLLPRTKDATTPIFKNDIQTLMNQCLEPQHFMIDTPYFDVEEDKHMAIAFCCRGDEADKHMAQCNATMQFMRYNKKLTFTEWTSGKPMVKFVNSKAAQLGSDDQLVTDAQISMLTNNVSISRVYTERISKPFDLLYANRCYVHSYVAQGMEEGEFAEAREDLGFLEKDYLDVVSEQVTDDYSD